MSILLADGFEDACLGIATLAQNGAEGAVYDVDKCVDVLRLRDGMSFEDAREYFEYNVRGS